MGDALQKSPTIYDRANQLAEQYAGLVAESRRTGTNHEAELGVIKSTVQGTQKFAELFCGSLSFHAKTNKIFNLSCPVAQPVNHPTLICLEKKCGVIDLFVEISKIYRPSGEEEEIRQYVQTMVKAAEKRWKDIDSIQLEKDPAGNILVHLPSTGQFKKKSLSPIALQSHLDMVLARKDGGIESEEELNRWFKKNGVSVEIDKSGWIHSKDYQTTIGVDNGIGIALMLRYILDPQIEHPPLELLFTVSEEKGLEGAKNLGLRMQSNALINLDGEATEKEPGRFIHGSLGAERFLITGTEQTVHLSDLSSVFLNIKVENLPGGHSGNDIHLGRLNPAQLAAGILIKFASFKPQLVNITSGSQEGLNKIPQGFEMVVAIPTRKYNEKLLSSITQFLTTKIRKEPLKNDMKKDDGTRPILFVGSIQLLKKEQEWALTAEGTQKLAIKIRRTPNGIIDKDQDYPHQILTSSNLGYFHVAYSAKEDQMEITFGFMTRGYDENRINSCREKIMSLLTFGSHKFIPGSQYPPWYTDRKSWLIQTVLNKVNILNKPDLAAAGLETSFLLASPFAPNLKSAISIGPITGGAHTVRERMKVESIERTQQAVDKLLIEIGKYWEKQ